LRKKGGEEGKIQVKELAKRFSNRKGSTGRTRPKSKSEGLGAMDERRPIRDTRGLGEKKAGFLNPRQPIWVIGWGHRWGRVQGKDVGNFESGISKGQPLGVYNESGTGPPRVQWGDKGEVAEGFEQKQGGTAYVGFGL